MNSAGKRDWSLPVKGALGFDRCFAFYAFKGAGFAFYAFNGLMTYLDDECYPEPPDHYTKRI